MTDTGYPGLRDEPPSSNTKPLLIAPHRWRPDADGITQELTSSPTLKKPVQPSRNRALTPRKPSVESFTRIISNTVPTFSFNYLAHLNWTRLLSCGQSSIQPLMHRAHWDNGLIGNQALGPLEKRSAQRIIDRSICVILQTARSDCPLHRPTPGI